ncbi:hypothetical protein EMIHUDRAFT_195991 [Emiliania huxleyi CCMP1516]|uniref:AP2/ERF domain-containing protein n=2 Tax=Emiliania huxleyi TaxID=2903 RepID=A0A0D3J399_EMIH1|nr:hypothetical protein EMIHUDRAFT_195991 [Emiliania huxleyi CCMP1516]EOD17984.1 hypothetical protein EMIHUDRAFT_195991 [Emiliania huxleyi CCMP1516]|eukprot:XP_005770413.1 hypothetical protein EMIHUDRAFT_195991 [Emiliania huxleyi CCMP1516]
MPLAPRTEALTASEPVWAASEPQGSAVATEAEGLRLHLSSSNSSTGYRGVSHPSSGRFQAKHTVGGRSVYIGAFGTAVEAAVAYARAVGEYQPPTVATEAEGLQLHLSSSGSTGYRGVYDHDSGRFQAKRRVDGKEVHLGTFDTAVEAAVAYARAISEASAVAFSARESAPPVELADEPAEPADGTILCGRTHEHDGGAAGCVLPAGHAGQHSFTLQGKRARCVKRPFDTTDVEAEKRGEGASTRDDSEVEVETTAGRAAPAGSEATSSREALVAEAEGLRLHLSSSNNTGYRGVHEYSGRFQARHSLAGKEACLGTFGTAVEAAVAYARAVGEYQPPTVATEAEGLRLHLSSSNSTGYRGVSKYPSTGRFQARHRVDGRQWRRLPSGMPGQLPAEWFCWMHPDPACRVCEAPEEESGPGQAPAERQAAAVAREAEGLRLHLSSNSTGYRGVWRQASGRFQAKCSVDGREVGLGTFDTAVEAAVAYARAAGEYQPPAQPPPTVATEAEGLRLHLSSSNSTGYKGVYELASGRFKAEHKVDGRTVYLGTYDTAVEAAVAYARAISEASAASSAPESATPAEPADETILCGRTHERDGGATGCVLPAGHAGQHSFTLQGKRARCVKRPFDPTDEAPVAEAEGLRLHLSSSSAGYRGVWRHASGRFQAKRSVDGKDVHVGYFDTAVEAAVAYARAVGVVCWMHPDPAGRVCEAPEEEFGPGRAQAERQAAAVATEAEGLRLHLSSSNSSTGYKGVWLHASGRFKAYGSHVYLGSFDTAVEAAAAYARAVGEYQPPAVATEAEGLRLHLSSSNNTGYLGVYAHASGRFEAHHKVGGRKVYIGMPVAAPADGNEAACPNCYCFACDAPVSACRHWRGGEPRVPAHCNAHAGSAEWRTQRSNAKRQRTRAARAARDPLGLG